MIKKIIISTSVLVSCIILQTTVFHYFAISGVIPNIYLIYLVYTSFHNSGLHGTSCGFISGLIEDVVSISPLGFHALIKIVIGSIFSMFNGLVILDRIIMPSIFVIIGTVLNRIIAFGAIAIFSLSVPLHSIFSKYFLIEIVYNTLLTPFVFFLADSFRLKHNRRGSIL